MKYPAHFEADHSYGGFVVTFRDIPEARTQGDTLEQAAFMATDALLLALEDHLKRLDGAPLPSEPLEGERLIAVPQSMSARIQLLNAVLAATESQSELAERLGMPYKAFAALFDVREALDLDTLENVLKVLGKKLSITIS